MFDSNLSIDAVWNILGWTMIHFFWIGTLMALVVTLARFALRQGPINVRYGITLGGFLALALAPIAIVVWLMMFVPYVAVEFSIETPTLSGFIGELAADLTYTPSAPGSAGGSSVHAPIDPRQNRELSSVGLSSTLILAIARLEAIVRFLPWLWLVGSPLTFVLLATGLIGAERLRRGCRLLDDGPVFDACLRLRKNLRIGRQVAVAVCDRLAVPVLVGIVRPLILLPAVAVGGWSPEQIEMVLVHELAHVRRWDNLINLVQRIVESLLFFHPAVWLMSAWLRRDREECCDALVVRHTNQPRAYAETLLAIAAQAAGSPLPIAGVALTGHARRLADRIRLILGQPHDPMLVSRKTLAAALVVLICSIALPLGYFPRDIRAEESDAIAETKAATHSEQAATSDQDAVSDPDMRLEIESTGTLTVAESSDGQFGISVVHQKAENPSGFPSLEEQKLADLAWKRLRVELEPIDREDLQRVQALGFDGGIKVTRAENWEEGIWTDDILVGLHVWPTASLKDVADVLNRDDVGELAPLKFYVIRHIDAGGRGFAPKDESDQSQDKIITGRIDVDVLSARGGRSSSRAAAAKRSDAPFGFQPTNSFDLYSAEGQRTGKVTLRTDPNAPSNWIEIGPPTDPEALFGSGSVKLDGEGRVHLQIAQQRKAMMKQLESLLGQLKLQRALADEPAVQSHLDEQILKIDKALQKLAAESQRNSSARNSEGTEREPEATIKENHAQRSALEQQLSVFEQQRAKATHPAVQKQLDRAIQEVEESLRKLDKAQGELDAATRELEEPSRAEPAASKIDGEAVVRQNASYGGAAYSDAPQNQRPRKGQLLYDGKTFNQWRDLWQNELSTLKRVEAVKALTAFGANGYGREASEAILNVARQLDWRMVENAKSDAGKLKNVCIEALTGGASTGGYRIPTRHWLPLLIEQTKKRDAAAKSFAFTVFSRLSSADSPATDPLLELSENPELKSAALVGLKAIDHQLKNERILARFREELQAADTPDLKIGLISSFILPTQSSGGGMGSPPTLRYVPELMPLLFDAQPAVRKQARQAISYIREEDAPAVLEQLLSIIVDDNRTPDRVEAIRSLAAIGSHAKPAENLLAKIVKSEEDETRIAAAFALQRSLGDEKYHERLRKIFGGKLQFSTDESGRRLVATIFEDEKMRGVYYPLTDSQILENEQKEVFPTWQQFGKGFGGGYGGF